MSFVCSVKNTTCKIVTACMRHVFIVKWNEIYRPREPCSD
jgi:hypothetical protein